MATISLKEMKVIGTLDGSTYHTRKYPKASAQTWSKGQLVYLSSGLLTVVATSGTTVLGLCTETAAATADDTTEYEVIPFTDNLKVVANANGSDTVTAQSDVGEDYGVYVTGNKCYVDPGSTSNVVFSVLDLYPEDAVGDTYGRLILVPKSDACQMNSAG